MESDKIFNFLRIIKLVLKYLLIRKNRYLVMFHEMMSNIESILLPQSFDLKIYFALEQTKT